jgi:hypothetical protein
VADMAFCARLRPDVAPSGVGLLATGRTAGSGP